MMQKIYTNGTLGAWYQPDIVYVLAELAWQVGFDYLHDNLYSELEVSTIYAGCTADIDLAFLFDGSGSVLASGFEAQKGRCSLSSPPSLPPPFSLSPPITPPPPFPPRPLPPPPPLSYPSLIPTPPCLCGCG